MKIKELIDIGARELRSVARRPKLEAELLLADALGQERIWLHMYYHDEVEAGRYFAMLELRKNHIPIEYITGRVGFYSREFLIEEGVLIPRPETELLIDRAGTLIGEHGCARVVEVGTGSGVISIMLALLHPTISLTATDINPKAIELARKNTARFEVAERIEFLHTSYLDGVEGEFDLLVSNPPYIAEGVELERHLHCEPQNALFAGERGDEMLTSLVQQAGERSIPRVAMEMGYDQRAAMETLLQSLGAASIEFYQDLAGLDRGFSALLRKDTDD